MMDLDALARVLAPMVLRHLAVALGASQSPYSTRRGHEPPEFRGRAKAWRSVAAGIPGGVRIGRWVSVPRDAYSRWLSLQTTCTTASNDTTAQPWTPAQALAEAGIRSTR